MIENGFGRLYSPEEVSDILGNFTTKERGMTKQQYLQRWPEDEEYVAQYTEEEFQKAYNEAKEQAEKEFDEMMEEFNNYLAGKSNCWKEKYGKVRFN
jgi:flagellar biosynthesis/type III secretory pathway protein FliH